jgi:ABC-type Mn2+/Zn2+ transport system ATPase subunit
MGNALAELNDVVIAVRGRSILGPLSLTVNAGDFLGVVGPNGAGKSTFLETLAGLRPVSGGRRTVPEPLQTVVGLLFQHHDYLPDLPFTAEDVVGFGRVGRAGLFRRFGPADRAAVDAAMAQMGLRDVRARPYRELSGGTRRRVHLARLLAQDAPLILLDEPTAGLDLAIQERLIRLIASLAGGDRAVVMVTHDIDHLPASCNRVILLKAGRILSEGAPDRTFQPDALSKLYGCRMGVERHEGRFHAYRLGEQAPA